MLRRRSASRAPTHAPTQDPHRPLLAPLHTHFSSPETRYTRSPGSIDERVTTHREPTIEGMSDGEQSGGRDHVQRGRDELGKLASGMDAAVDSPFPDARRSAEFRRHANTSLHSLLSRHGTLLEHHPADSGPPTASTSAYPTGHIVAPGSASSSDWTDLDALKPPRNADDEHLARGRQLFTSPEEQARENERIVGRMHRWMDELVVMQEGIAALHMKLEGVGMDGEGFEGKAGEAERGEDGKETTPSDGKQARDEAEEKREDHIMDEMIEQLHQLFAKLQDFHATPHPTIAFSSSRTAASAVNTAPGTPRISHEEDEREPVGSSWLSRENSADAARAPTPSSSSPEKTVEAGAVPGTSVKRPMDPDHPRQFLRPKQHHDYARDPQPRNGQGVRDGPPRDVQDHKDTVDRRTPSRPHPIVTKPITHHHADHADLRRRVLQSQDRRRAESVESLVALDDARREGAVDGRPGATRTWSTVLEG